MPVLYLGIGEFQGELPVVVAVAHEPDDKEAAHSSNRQRYERKGT